MAKSSTSKKKSSKKSLSTTQRVLILLSVGIAGIILVPITSSFISYGVLRVSLPSEVDGARQNKAKLFSELRQTQLAELQSKQVITSTDSVYSESFDACYLAHVDSGWIAQNYYQECYIRSIEVFASNLTEEEYLQKVTPHKSNQYISVGLLSKNSRVCGARDESNWDRDKSSVNFIAKDEAQESTKVCVVPYANNTERVVLYARPSINATQTKVGNRQDVTNTQSYAVLVTDYVYINRNLGCRPASLFCESPIDRVDVGSRDKK